MTVDEQIEFGRTIEGTFVTGLNASNDEGLKGALRAAGLDLDKKLLPGYPAELFHRWIEVSARHLYPEVELQEGARQVGRRSVPALEDTLIGRALAAGLKLLGPRRTLERSERVWRNNGNYQVIKVTDVTDAHATATIAFTFGVPGFYQGVFEQALSIIGAKNLKIELKPSPPPTGVLDISWQP